MEDMKDLEIVKELLNTKQYTSLRQHMGEMNEADIATCIEELDEEDMLKVFRIMSKDMAADVFSYLEVDTQQFIITGLAEKDAAGIIDNLMADDATDLLEEMPANIVKKLLANASAETRRDINHLLRYPEDSAGSIMTVEYVDLKVYMTVDDAIARIRQRGVDSETINICYVTDANRKLLGTVALRYLLILPGDSIIGDIMHENVIYINTLMDQEEVARQFQNTTSRRCLLLIMRKGLLESSRSMMSLIFCRKRPQRIWKRWPLSFLRTSPILRPRYSRPGGRGCPGFYFS